MAIERKSKQRDAIIAELRSCYDHPTAMELFLAVRKKLPSLSLGTLYRNLSQLEESGMILRIPDGSTDRFDGNPSPHAHFKCTLCGKLYDIHSDNNYSFDLSDDNISQICGYNLTLFGHCKSCDSNRTDIN